MSSVIRGSDNFDSAAKSGTIEATASGALANGDLVVVNTDGTVSTVTGSGNPGELGTAVTFTPSSIPVYTSAAYDSVNQKVVVAYKDSAVGYGYAIVGTVSGTSISFGTPVLFKNTTVGRMGAVYDAANQKIVIAYDEEGTYSRGTAVVGTVSGTSISFGTPVYFDTTATGYLSAVYDPVNQKVVIAYRDEGNGNYGTAVVGTVSGTSISFGSKVVFESSSIYRVKIAYDANAQKVVIVYCDLGNSSYGTAVVGTVSGTSISFGTPVVFHSASTDYTNITYDSTAQKVVIVYTDNGNSYKGTAVVGTVSGTSISFGSDVVFANASANFFSLAYDANAQKVVIAFKDEGYGSYGTFIVGIVSGTSIIFLDPEEVFNAGQTQFTAAVYDANAQSVVIAYHDITEAEGQAIVYATDTQTTNLTTTNYIGISDGAYADGATATIQVVGAVDDAQSGLTAGELYYILGTGSLSTTPDGYNVLAGTAVSSTKLIIKG